MGPHGLRHRPGAGTENLGRPAEPRGYGGAGPVGRAEPLASRELVRGGGAGTEGPLPVPLPGPAEAGAPPAPAAPGCLSGAGAGVSSGGAVLEKGAVMCLHAGLCKPSADSAGHYFFLNLLY